MQSTSRMVLLGVTHSRLLPKKSALPTLVVQHRNQTARYLARNSCAFREPRRTDLLVTVRQRAGTVLAKWTNDASGTRQCDVMRRSRRLAISEASVRDLDAIETKPDA